MNAAFEPLDPLDDFDELSGLMYAHIYVRWTHGARDGLTGHQADVHAIAAGRAAFVIYTDEVVRVHITCVNPLHYEFRDLM